MTQTQTATERLKHMGIQHRKPDYAPDRYALTDHDQLAVDPDEIDPDAPTHCEHCGDALTPLRRLSGRAFCAHKPACNLVSRRVKTTSWRIANLHKQGETVIILDLESAPVQTARRS